MYKKLKRSLHEAVVTMFLLNAAQWSLVTQSHLAGCYRALKMARLSLKATWLTDQKPPSVSFSLWEVVCVAFTHATLILSSSVNGFVGQCALFVRFLHQ